MEKQFQNFMEVVYKGDEYAIIYTSPGRKAGTTQVGIRQFDTATHRYKCLKCTTLPARDIDGVRFEWERCIDKAQELGYSLIKGIA